MHEFYDGRKVKAITFTNEAEIGTEHPNVISMEISMENGHMALLPFVKIVRKTGETDMVSVNEVFVTLEVDDE